VNCPVDVGHGPRLADEFAHEHEQRDDGELVGAQRFISRAREHVQDDVEVSTRDEIDAERTRHTQRNGDMHSEHDHHQEADYQYGCDIGFEHDELSGSSDQP